MNDSKLQGFETPGDQKVPVTVRDWNAMRLALWRSKNGWDIASREAATILTRCAHTDGCPGAKIESEPCMPECPDREQRMSALVILNAARMHAPVDAKRAANDPYMAPSREYYSEVLASLAVAQAEIETLRDALAVQTSADADSATLPAPAPELLEEAQEAAP